MARRGGERSWRSAASARGKKDRENEIVLDKLGVHAESRCANAEKTGSKTHANGRTGDGRHAERRRHQIPPGQGERSGVSGTPTFYVNGIRHDGGYDLESLRSAILAHTGGCAEAHSPHA